MEKLFKEILKKITPTAEEHKKENKLVEDISKKLAKYDVKPILVGSLAKGTDIRGDKDIDIFIMFHKDVSRPELEKRGLDIGKKVFGDMKIPYEIDYAEHPYLSGAYENYKIEIVPCYDTKEVKSAVDRTPYHTHYVKKRLAKEPGLKDEIRLLKQFMKGAGVYGAEAKVEGFSGYLCELLALSYGSFTGALNAAASWKYGEAIDPEGLWKDKNALKYFFTGADLIIVDPVDKDRNAAAAVSKQRMAEYMVASREFLKKPGQEYFFQAKKKDADAKELLKRMKARGTKLIALELTHPKINPNTLYSQLRKTREAVNNSIQEQGFRVLKSDLWTDEGKTSLIIYELEVFALPNIKHRTGPPVDRAVQEQENFLKKYSKYKPYIRNGNWAADIKRENTRIEDLMQKIIEKREGFGKNLRTLKEIKAITGEEILKTGNKGLLAFMDGFVTPI